MTQVTQLIPSYLGGVSKQTDDKKKPGQVSECVNGMPDITYGLLKRSGFNWQRNVVDGSENSLEHAKWFFVTRGGLDAYVGAITNDEGLKGTISIWNAVTGVQGIVNYPNGKDYLDVTYDSATKIGPEQLYSVTTIQDVTVITNTTKEVKELAAPTGVTLDQNGTVKILLVEYGAEYKVTVNGKTATYKTRNFDEGDDPSADYLDADEILTNLKSQIDGLGIANLTVTKLPDCLELVMSTGTINTLEAVGGIGNGALQAYITDVTDESKLAAFSLNGRKVQIINASGDEDDYWREFEAEDGTSGTGTWIECRDPTVSAGIDASTAPFELEFEKLDAGVATFNFKEIDWAEREAGDDVTNIMPSFVGSTISYTFFYSNRFGILSDDNVILSQANEPYNFFRKSAQLVIDSDPIDNNVSSVQPVRLISVRPEPQGLVLFGNNEQFRMYSVDSRLTPQTSQIRTLSTYEMAEYIPAESVGTSSAMINKVPGYTRVFLYETRGLDEPPSVVDIGKTVTQWIPDTVTNLTCSAQNSIVMLSSSRTNEIHLYRYFNSGEKDLFQAWVKWDMPGKVVGLQIINDQIFAITYQENQWTLLVSNLNDTGRNNIVKTPLPFTGTPLWTNPYLDMSWIPTAAQVNYDPTDGYTYIDLPFNSVSGLIPTIMLTANPVGAKQVRTDLISLSTLYEEVQTTVTPVGDESGYFRTPEVVGNQWKLKGDWSASVGKLVAGYRFKYEIEFPITYYNPGEQKYDFTANLTIARHRFSVAFTGALQFSLQAAGRDEWDPIYQVTDADYYPANQAPLVKERVMTVPVYQRNLNYKLKVEDTSPFPTSLISQMWEGNYVPRFYKRKII